MSPRPAAIPGKPYDTTVSVKLNKPGTAVLDRLRGPMSRSEYFRTLLRAADAADQRNQKGTSHDLR